MGRGRWLVWGRDPRGAWRRRQRPLHGVRQPSLLQVFFSGVFKLYSEDILPRSQGSKLNPYIIFFLYIFYFSYISVRMDNGHSYKFPSQQNVAIFIYIYFTKWKWSCRCECKIKIKFSIAWVHSPPIKHFVLRILNSKTTKLFFLKTIKLTIIYFEVHLEMSYLPFLDISVFNTVLRGEIHSHHSEVWILWKFYLQ